MWKHNKMDIEITKGEDNSSAGEADSDPGAKIFKE